MVMVYDGKPVNPYEYAIALRMGDIRKELNGLISKGLLRKEGEGYRIILKDIESLEEHELKGYKHYYCDRIIKHFDQVVTPCEDDVRVVTDIIVKVMAEFNLWKLPEIKDVLTTILSYNPCDRWFLVIEDLENTIIRINKDDIKNSFN